MAFFLPIRYLEGKARRKIFEKYPPKTVWASSSRIRIRKNGIFDLGNAVAYCWIVWQKNYKGETILKWFN